MKKIDWKRGSGTLVIMAAIIVLITFSLWLYLTVFNVTFTRSLVTTKADIIADSVAAYAQSYDYQYNQSQAELMTNILTQLNSSSTRGLALSTQLTFSDGSGGNIKQSMHVRCDAEFDSLLPGIGGTVHASSDATVDSVDVFGDIFVVPGRTPTPPESSSGDDVLMP